MDFFGRQDQARRNSALLVGLYVGAVALIGLAVFLLVKVMLEIGAEDVEIGDVELLIFCLGGVLVLIGGGSLYRMASITSGEAVARMMGAEPLGDRPQNEADLRLRNVVEEMAIAAGVPVPGIWVMRGETGINAFAAGHGPEDAVVAVTQGALNLLDRDELQGVVAHEFSHIINRDVRLNLRMVGVLYGILMISLLGRILLRASFYSGSGRRRSRSSRGGKGEGGAVMAMVAAGAGLWAIGSIGLFFARFIKQSVSRQREYLADAAAAQFTRNPTGLAGALKKIGGSTLGGRMRTAQQIQNAHAEEAEHMFFTEGASRLGAMFSTHPPLRDRILRLEPAWDGTLPDMSQPGLYKQPEAPAKPPPVPRTTAPGAPPPLPFPVPGMGGRLPGLPSAGPGIPGLPGAGGGAMSPVMLAFVAAIGNPDARNLEAARRVLDRMPAPLKDAAHDPEAAPLVVLALTSGGEGMDAAGLAGALRLPPESRDRFVALRTEMADLDRDLHLPLADLCLPALRRLPREAQDRFLTDLDRAVHLDQDVDLLEYVLMRMVQRQLILARESRPRRPAHIFGWPGLARQASVVLSALAWYGADDAQAEASFQAALRVLGDHVQKVRFLPRAECGLEAVHEALTELETASAKLKRQLLGALATAAGADQVITPEQAELFRAVADALGVPVPLLTPDMLAEGGQESVGSPRR